MIAQAIAQALRLLPEDHAVTGGARSVRTGLILFTAEQGFAGAFSDRMLEAARPLLSHADVFLIGTRGGILADEQRLHIPWRTEMALHSDGAAAVAARVCDALYERSQQAPLTRVELMFPSWIPGTGLVPCSRSLLPLEHEVFAGLRLVDTPLITLAPTILLEQLAEEYVYAQLCEAATEALVAENEARVTSMATARTNVERMLQKLQARERQVRQEEITAEVVELSGSRS